MSRCAYYHLAGRVYGRPWHGYSQCSVGKSWRWRSARAVGEDARYLAAPAGKQIRFCLVYNLVEGKTMALPKTANSKQITMNPAARLQLLLGDLARRQHHRSTPQEAQDQVNAPWAPATPQKEGKSRKVPANGPRLEHLKMVTLFVVRKQTRNIVCYGKRSNRMNGKKT